MGSRAWAVFGTALLSALTVGCDSKDESGISGSKKLGDLTTSEVQSLCKETQQKVTRVGEASAALVCTELSFGEDDCEAQVEQCLEDMDPEDAPGISDFDCSEASDSECADATVSEMRACINALVKTAETLADSFTCTKAPTSAEPPETPKACRDIGSRCPAFSAIFD